jgi:small-conductance mechanosensitive channel
MKKYVLFLTIFFITIYFKDVNAQIFGNNKVIFSDTSVQEKPKPINVIDINFEIEKTHKLLKKLSNQLTIVLLKTNIDSVLIKQKKFLNDEAKIFHNYNPNNLSQYFLENSYRAWLGYQNKLTDASFLINDKLSFLENGSKRLFFEKERWELTLKTLNKNNNIPYGLKEKVRQVIYDINNLQQQFDKKKNKLLTWDNEITDLLLLSNGVLSQITTLQSHLYDSLFFSNKKFLWKVNVSKNDIFPIGIKLNKAVDDNIRIIKNYFVQQNFYWILLWIIIVSIFLFRLKSKYFKNNFDNIAKKYRDVDVLLNKHFLPTYFILILMSALFKMQTMPLSLTSLLATLMVIAVYFVVPDYMGKQGKIRIVMILILYFLNEFEILMWYFGDLARFYLFFESATGIWLTYRYGLNRFKKPSNKESAFVKRTFLLAGILFAIYSLGFLLNIFGFVSLSVLLFKVAAHSATLILIVYSLQKILKILINALCEFGRNDVNNSFYGYWDLIETRLKHVINILAVYFGIKIIFGIFGLYRSFYEHVTNILTYDLIIGKISISLGGIIGMILIIFLFYIFSRAVEIFITNNKTIKSKFSPGVAFATATSIKYFFVFIGLILGMSFAGIDIGKFSLFTGALGVGIGFGLQNIVNNFISGLILLYERPVEVGDTIEVGELMGIVKKIGVRASRVRTYDGAEVVVPNGNIISNDLINWTLSDDKKRLEIKVGVAYGSDVNKVLKILKQVAKDNEKVFNDPKPLVLFEEFGDSSLNFRLLCWIPFDKGLSLRSEISTAIYNAFDKEGVEIPFPQLDLHVKDIKNELTEKPKVVMPKAPDNSPQVADQDDSNAKINT